MMLSCYRNLVKVTVAWHGNEEKISCYRETHELPLATFNDMFSTKLNLMFTLT